MSIGWGTIAYGAIAGVCSAVGIVFLLIGGRRRPADAGMISFGVFALAGAAVTVTTVRLHATPTRSDYRAAFKVFGLMNLLAVLAVVGLAAAWSRSVPRWALTAFAVATAPIAILQVALPHGLPAGDIEALRAVELFGERFVVHEGPQSAWRPILDVYLAFGFSIVCVGLVRGYRRGYRTDAAVVSIALVIGLLFGAWDTLVDLGRVNTPYLLPLGTLITAIAGAAYLAEQSVRVDQRLHDQTIRLEETVIDRTAALIESNRRLEGEIARQRRTVRDLAVLAEEFEASNALVEPTPAAIRSSLHDLLGQLGAVLPATEVELRIDDEGSAEILPRSSAWRSPDERRDGSVAGSTVLAEPIRLGTRWVGELTARLEGDPNPSDGEARYMQLTAEHLAGLVHRLELVGRVADSAVASERQRIAMDLHDSVTQRMYSVSFLADAAVHLAEEDPASAVEPVKRVRELVLSSLAELRALLFELRPNMFESEDLDGLIRQLADSVASTSELDIVVQAQPVPPVAADLKIGVYRIAQEALSNACRHSGASRVSVTLGHDHGVTTLEISDDGVGFSPSEAHGGSGLGHLRARAGQIGAELDVLSRPDSGTTVAVRWAHPVEAAAPTEQAVAR